MRYAIAERYDNELRRRMKSVSFPLERFLLQQSRRLGYSPLFWPEHTPANCTPVYVIESEPPVACELQQLLGEQVWVEREVVHTPQAPLAVIDVQVSSAVGGLGDALVILTAETTPGQATSVEALTDTSGQCHFSHSYHALVELIASPRTDHWQMLVKPPASTNHVQCPPVVFPSSGIGWWHQRMGVHHVRPIDGNLIRVGVIDSGCAPHPALAGVIQVGTFVNNVHHSKTLTVGGLHGTHVCGIIAAQPQANRGFWGMAPGCELYSASLTGNIIHSNQWDIRKAIEHLSLTLKVDLINLSYASETRTDIVIDGIRKAADAGTLCLAAAGNLSGPVAWPARSSSTVAVSALGEVGRYPGGTVAESHLRRSTVATGALDLAHFSCRGPEIDCCGPGVGIVSTVPGSRSVDNFWLPLDGTSMAAPMVTGGLARRLAATPHYRFLPRDLRRTKLARNLLVSVCASQHLPANFEGAGLPMV